VKTIKVDLAEEAGFRTRFAQEVAAAGRVSGFFTAAVVEADPEADLPWLATAYVPAPSLARLVKACGPLPVGAVRWLAASDVYALGATLVFAATGRPPYQGDTVMDVLARLATEEPEYPSPSTYSAWVRLMLVIHAPAGIAVTMPARRDSPGPAATARSTSGPRPKTSWFPSPTRIS